MSKNTSSSQFRHVDVDKYTDENYEEEENGVNNSSNQGPDKKKVDMFLQSKSYDECLKYLMDSAPIGEKNETIRNNAMQLVLTVLTSVRSSEIDVILKSLNQTQMDILMKYIYKGFENPNENSSAQLLVWHEKVFSISGTGCIVRVLTDRKKI